MLCTGRPFLKRQKELEDEKIEIEIKKIKEESRLTAAGGGNDHTIISGVRHRGSCGRGTGWHRGSCVGGGLHS